MAHHQPEMKKLQAKYKGDKERLNQELMKFYRENKVNPLASCLPLVAQIPVFISLFYMLRTTCAGTSARRSTARAAVTATRSPAVGGDAAFLFIHDLTTRRPARAGRR